MAVHAARGPPQGGHAAHQGPRAGRALQEAGAGDVIQVSSGGRFTGCAILSDKWVDLTWILVVPPLLQKIGRASGLDDGTKHI